MSSTGIYALNRPNYARRKIGSMFMGGLCIAAAGVGLVFLALILVTLVQRGSSAMSLDLFTQPMDNRRGLANAIMGSLIQTGLGAAFGAPLGMAVGVYLSEVGKNGRFAQIVRFVNDILLSAPSILIGLFVYQMMVYGHGYSGLAGSVALALLAMPVVARTTEDILKLVPDSYREGSIALGARDSTTVSRVLIPAAFGGILTGILLAVARISGETAPLLFTSFGNSHYQLNITGGPMASLPWAIYNYAAKSPEPALNNQAWAGALIITFGVLLFNVLSRLSHFLVSRAK
ncbi:MAG: phosphate ABC transporter permease PstA [Pseudomonadota bacterium]